MVTILSIIFYATMMEGYIRRRHNVCFDIHWHTLHMMKTLLIVVACAFAAQAADIVDPADCTAYPCLIFNDEFDYLDLTAWEHEMTLGGGGNWEFQGYVNNRSVTYTHDSTLFIRPQLTADWQDEAFLTTGTWDMWGGGRWNDHCTGNSWYGCLRNGPDGFLNPVMSGRIRTLPFFGFKYGRIEVRARLPSGDWLWPAIWMLPRYSDYGGWPASGEFDLLESRGNEDYGTLGCQYGGTTFHWGPSFFLNQWNLTHVEYQSPTGSFADSFHIWAMEWTDTDVKVFLDGVEVLNVDPGTNFWDFAGLETSGYENPWRYGTKMAPFDQQFSIILNVAVGGTNGFFPDGIVPNKPWANTDSNAPEKFWNARADWLPTWQHGEGKISENAAMQVDYVKVYKLTA